jgi:EAL domain-containing protein (putative c-di-GMP-specific phosphodiesterase class I)
MISSGVAVRDIEARARRASRLRSRRRTTVLVELANHAHLCLSYGVEFGQAALRSLQWRTHEEGASIVALDGHRFVAEFPSLEASLIALQTVPLIERLQIKLSTTPIYFGSHCALPVVTIQRVRMADSCLFYPKLNDESVAQEVALLPPQSGLPWVRNYEHDMEIALALYGALTDGRSGLRFQPIRSCAAGENILYREGLLRLSTPLGAVAGAMSEIVPALERVGLVRALDRSVVLTVLGALEALPELHLGCNLSANSLVRDAWWETIVESLAAKPRLAARLTLEITETAPIHDIDRAVSTVRLLKSYGVRIAIDDFGAGYSSLAFARAALPQVIKIDSSVIQGARQDANNFEHAQRLIDLCGTLADEVVAEGIESEEDIKLARSLGASHMQGHAINSGEELCVPLNLKGFQSAQAREAQG